MQSNRLKLETDLEEYQNSLSKSRRAKAYLELRGINEESITRFKLGYANKGIFKDRIIFPIFDMSGDIQGFTTRFTSLVKTSHSHRHSPGMKMNWFYNEVSLVRDLAVFICESPIDCITLEQHGYNSVACMGANNINKGKIEKLRYISKIYICFDNDVNEVGQKATERVGKMISKINPEVYRVHIPFITGPDINAMHTKLPEYQFKDIFEEAVNLALKIKPPEERQKSSVTQTNLQTKFPILDTIEKYVDHLIPCGLGRFKCLCPFHDEAEPSFNVDVAKERFKCFGCGRSGDSIDFIREIHAKMGRAINFKEAIDLLRG
jgi:DNA primase